MKKVPVLLFSAAAAVACAFSEGFALAGQESGPAHPPENPETRAPASTGDGAGAELAKAPEAAKDFAKDVRPLLETYCWDCHGDGEILRRQGSPQMASTSTSRPSTKSIMLDAR